MNTKTISLDQLKEAFLTWELEVAEHGQDDSRANPDEQALYLWDVLERLQCSSPA